jgi:hypothetical protein
MAVQLLSSNKPAKKTKGNDLKNMDNFCVIIDTFSSDLATFQQPVNNVAQY